MLPLLILLSPLPQLPKFGEQSYFRVVVVIVLAETGWQFGCSHNYVSLCSSKMRT